MNKIYWLILLIIVLVAGGIYFYSAQQNESSSVYPGRNIQAIYTPDGKKTNLGKDAVYLYGDNGNGWKVYAGQTKPENFDDVGHYFVDGVDTPSFESLGQDYFIDKSRVYFMDWKGEAILNEDPESFTVVSGNADYDAQGKNHRYQYGRIVK